MCLIRWSHLLASFLNDRMPPQVWICGGRGEASGKAERMETVSLVVLRHQGLAAVLVRLPG